MVHSSYPQGVLQLIVIAAGRFFKLS